MTLGIDPAILVILILIAALVLFVTEWIPLPATAMSVAVAFYLIGAIDADTALKSFASSTAMIIAAMVPVAKAMTNSGAADMIANASLSVLGSLKSPVLILCLIFLIITPLTNFMSNAATIILFTPIALIVAETLGIGPKAILIAVRFAASIAIATPVAMPANSMAVEPGGYKFIDYVKPGLPLTLICIAVSIVYIALFYPLG